MQSSWRRCGRIIGPDALPGDYRLTQVPTAWQLPDGLLRVFFSARDKNNCGQLLAVDLDPEAGMCIVREHYQPLVAIGSNPRYPMAGIGPGEALNIDGRLCLYGTALDHTVRPYDCSVVLLTSDNDGLSFNSVNQALSSADNDGYPVALPAVKHHNGTWHLWYTAFERWLLDIKPHPDARYQIGHATSVDGRVWHPDKGKAIQFASSAEVGLARPTILEAKGRLEMWFSVRGPYSNKSPSLRYYRIAYAVSKDGEAWQRIDEEHRFVNPARVGEWDHQMQCYPNVFQVNGRTCMLYCGNWYGAGGFGYAMRED